MNGHYVPQMYFISHSVNCDVFYYYEKKCTKICKIQYKIFLCVSSSASVWHLQLVDGTKEFIQNMKLDRRQNSYTT